MGGTKYNLSENLVYSKILDKYKNKPVLWDDLPSGAYARYEFDKNNFRVLYRNKLKSPKHSRGDSQLIPTYDFKLSVNELEQQIDRILVKYKNKKNLMVMVPVRLLSASLDYIEAGVALHFDD